MRSLLVLGCALSLGGCFPYQRLNSTDIDHWGVGYSEEAKAEGRYAVRYDGTSTTSYELLRRRFLQRAGELCPGSFDLTDYEMNAGLVIHASKPVWRYVSGFVRCTAPPSDYSLESNEGKAGDG
jgi:hypothetical protein